jgi:hypothetical protein
MGMDDLLKGLSVFQEGMKQLATTNAVTDANQKLTEVNSQALDRAQKLEMHTQIGNELAMRLGAAGADAAHIQTLTSQIAPSMGAQFQAEESKQLQLQSEKFQSGEKSKDRANAIALEQMKLDALSGKGGQKAMDEAMKRFEKRPDVKPLLDNFPKIDEALQRVNDTKGKMGATAAVNLAKLGLIRGAAGRVNEMEIQGADESPSVRAKLWKQMGLQSTGEVPENVQEFWQQVLQKSKQHIAGSVIGAISAHAKGEAAVNDHIDETRLATGLTAKFGNVVGSVQQQVAQKQQQQQMTDAQIAQAQQWLAKPEAKKDPVLYQKVLQEVNRRKSTGGAPPAASPPPQRGASNDSQSDSAYAMDMLASAFGPEAPSAALIANRNKMKVN